MAYLTKNICSVPKQTETPVIETKCYIHSFDAPSAVELPVFFPLSIIYKLAALIERFAPLSVAMANLK